MNTTRRKLLSQQDIREVVQAVHVKAMDGGWTVLKAGPDKRVRRNFSDRDSALSFAEKLAGTKSQELIVHRSDGRVIRHAEKAVATRLARI